LALGADYVSGSDGRNAHEQRIHVVLSEQLVKDIDRLVGPRQRSSFLTQAAEKELMRLRQMKALKAVAGAWKDEDHPELKQGADKWVRKLRQESERRFKKVTGGLRTVQQATPERASP
jgi:hypothetical protein